MTKKPRNSINDGWRTKATLRRSVSVLLAAFSLSTLVSFTPNSAIAASADGTRGEQVVDASGAVWTFNGLKTLRNGVWVGGGEAVEYLYQNQTVYVIASDYSVWSWTGSQWTPAPRDVATLPSNAAANTLRSIATTGSVAAGSNQLTVASASGFAVGDWVIVEIGKEAGQGQRGTRGVGGTWPSKSYPTEAALLADRSQPNQFYAWAEDTGYAYLWVDNQWYDLDVNRPNTFYTGQYYLGKAVPRSLQARITAISGNTLTLDKSAAASASGANVYLDTAPILSNMIANGGSVSLPAGDFATGGVVWIRDKGGVVLSGQGKDKTRIFSLKGVPSAMIQAFNVPSTTVRDLTLHGNFRDQGFGFNWTGSTAAGAPRPVTETDFPQGAGFPRGILMDYATHNSVVQDVTVIDVGYQAVGVSFSDNTWARRVVNIQNDLMRQYIQWQFQWGDSSGGGCEDCEVRSTYVIPGFESFKATGTQFIRPKGINALFALNGAGNWLIDGADLRFTPNSLSPESDRIGASPHHPIININAAFSTPYIAQGGTIRNMTIIQSGYVNANNDTLKGVNVNDQMANIRVEGLAYYAPDYKSGSVVNGPLGMNSTGPSTTVNGVQVIGKPQPGRANIFIMHGGGVNCTAQVVEGCSAGSFTTPVMQAFLAGDTSGWTLPSGSNGDSGGSSSSGSGSTTPPPAPQPPSANGTRGAQVVDSTGAVWTFDGTRTLRNGVWMNPGEASEYLYANSTVYAIGSDGSLWKFSDGWSYAGNDIAALTGGSSGSGSSGGSSGSGSATSTPSPHGTRGKQIVDSTGAVWTFDGTKTLRNGVWMNPGEASEYLYANSTVYAITSDGNLWKWNDGWAFAGSDVAAILALASGNGTTPTPTEPTPPVVKKPAVSMDFPGNGKSNVLWRRDASGQNSIWSIEASSVKRTPITGAPANWDAVGMGDFDADGKADILWRDEQGNVAIWLMNDTVVAGGGVVANAPKSWKVAGVGDFNGDGKADILWRASDGTVSMWLMDGVTIAARGTLVTVPTPWTIGGIGDLNKDGKADVVWRHSDGSVVTWLMNGAEITQSVSTAKVPTAWSIAGVADYNGDGKADLLWRTAKGQNTIWYMDAGKQTGTLALSTVNDATWTIVGTGDYNGDGKADIMWRNTNSGNNAMWILNGAQATKPTLPNVADLDWAIVKP